MSEDTRTDQAIRTFTVTPRAYLIPALIGAVWLAQSVWSLINEGPTVGTLSGVIVPPLLGAIGMAIALSSRTEIHRTGIARVSLGRRRWLDWTEILDFCEAPNPLLRHWSLQAVAYVRAADGSARAVFLPHTTTIVLGGAGVTDAVMYLRDQQDVATEGQWVDRDLDAVNAEQARRNGGLRSRRRWTFWLNAVVLIVAAVVLIGVALNG